MSSAPAFLHAACCPALTAAHVYSSRQIALLEQLFEARAAQLDAVETVAVGGSLGRFEASADSDIDCIIVLRDDASQASGDQQVLLVHEIFAQTAFKAPKANGIYRDGIARRQLLDTRALGSLGEAPAVFGKRIQLLLDARPVFAQQRCQRLQRAVIDWYASDFIALKPSRGWTYLSNDVMRYLHSYAAWQQFKFERSADDSWQLRQAKFRSSRLLTFAAMMFLLGESDGNDNKREWLCERLPLTPLERLHAIMTRYDGAAYQALLIAYEACFAALADSAVRATLVTTGPDDETRMSAALHSNFERLRQSSAELAAQLTEFALARRAQWGARFFERWLF
jgi:hypothetical protein